MRKLISLLLALVMIMSFATVVLAEENVADHYDQNKSFTKKYTVTNGVSPEETFTFKFTAVSGTNNDGESVTPPALGDVTASFAEGASHEDATVTVDLSKVEWPALGKYIYTVAEVDNNVSGVTYNTNGLYMVVTVLRDEESNQHYVAAIHLTDAEGTKTASLENSYNAGKLTVKKTITGNMADMNDTFNFKITITDPENDIIKSTITVNDKAWEYTPATEVVITGTLGHGQELVIDNIPATCTYTVEETDADTNGYTMSQTAADGSITGGDTDVWAFVNDRTDDVDTGISLDSVPFVVMMVVCAAAAVLFIIKRRSVEF